jgi:hypothetical protein
MPGARPATDAIGPSSRQMTTAAPSNSPGTAVSSRSWRTRSRMRYAVHYAVRAEAVTSSGVAKYAPRNEIASSASAADDGSTLAGVLGVLAP